MAKVTGPLHSSEARGGVGGVVFNSYRGMAVVKAKTAPAQPNSTKQLQQRARTSTISRLWSSCVNKAAWESYASAHPHVDGLGNSVRSSGINSFMAINNLLSRFNFPLLDLPPTAPPPSAPLPFTAVGAVASVIVNSLTSDPEVIFVEYLLDGPRSAGASGSLSNARFFSWLAADGDDKTLAPLRPGRFTVYVRSFSVENGQVSPWISADVYVT